MDDLNLIPLELKEAKLKKKKEAKIIAIVIASILVFVGLSCIPLYFKYNIDKENSIIEFQINQLSNVKEQMNTLNQQKTAAQSRINMLSGLPGQDTRWSDILTQISRLIPPDVSVKSLGGSLEGITLDCSTTSMQSIAVFYANLENCDKFTELRINDITPDNAAKTIDFNLFFKLKVKEGKVN